MYGDVSLARAADRRSLTKEGEVANEANERRGPVHDLVSLVTHVAAESGDGDDGEHEGEDQQGERGHLLVREGQRRVVHLAGLREGHRRSEKAIENTVHEGH